MAIILNRLPDEMNFRFPSNAKFSTGSCRKTVSRKRLKKLWELQCRKCFYCQRQAAIEECNIDHVMPLCKGGTNDFANLVASCVGCNAKKAGRRPTPDELMRLRNMHK